jgi:nicotinate dehydrogenase subunit A
VLRNDLALNGPKYGCGLGECGACAVLIDGVAARACVIPVGGLADRTDRDAGRTRDADNLHPVQQAFVAEQAAQCGYCLNGMIMTAVALLNATRTRRRPIREALKYNLCRCGTHVEIVNAVCGPRVGHRSVGRSMRRRQRSKPAKRLSDARRQFAGRARRNPAGGTSCSPSPRWHASRLQRPCRSRHRHPHRAGQIVAEELDVAFERVTWCSAIPTACQSGRDHRQRNHPDHGASIFRPRPPANWSMSMTCACPACCTAAWCVRPMPASMPAFVGTSLIAVDEASVRDIPGAGRRGADRRFRRRRRRARGERDQGRAQAQGELEADADACPT